MRAHEPVSFWRENAIAVAILLQILAKMSYSQLSLRRTPLGLALAVRLIESQIEGERKAGTNSRCPFYRGVRLIEVSVKREYNTIQYSLFNEGDVRDCAIIIRRGG